MEAFGLIILVIALLVSFYMLYKLFVLIARKTLGISPEDKIISGEVKSEGTKFSFKLKDWFVWNVQSNSEKGTAGGNIKINFPIKSSIALACLCLIIACFAFLIPVAKYLIPLIFLSFAFYHFLVWSRSLKSIREVASDYSVTAQAKPLCRDNDTKLVAGVCSGIAHKFSIPVWLIRALFLISNLLFLLGLLTYLILWKLMPADKKDFAKK